MHLTHTIPPTYDEHSRVLVLGSFPSPKSREGQYNYGHPQNRFWRVLSTLAKEDLPTTNEQKRNFCLRHGIALWDVVAECDIQGASDASIRNAKPNRLSLITKAAPIGAVYCTGAKAFELYRRLGCERECGLPATRLPSTSPANAACGMDKLLEAYAVIFE
ncbi:MAG: DNA-deoxyinosine glycosylase [Atopobiaceae bacterium]|nr:DNA-deoxyinosine glycosylase [Atopobiaceae bacterium]